MDVVCVTSPIGFCKVIVKPKKKKSYAFMNDLQKVMDTFQQQLFISKYFTVLLPQFSGLRSAVTFTKIAAGL